MYDGDLGAMPVFLVAPADLSMVDVNAMAQAMATVAGEDGGPGTVDVTRLQRFYARTRERYLATSSRSERIYAPAGTGHNFPYETPEIVVEAVSRMLREHPRADGVD